jgi:hypothetical protein
VTYIVYLPVRGCFKNCVVKKRFRFASMIKMADIILVFLALEVVHMVDAFMGNLTAIRRSMLISAR